MSAPSGPPGPPGPAGPGLTGEARVADRLAHQRMATLMPFIIGTYIDTVLLGLVAILLVYWVRHVRPTDHRWVRGIIMTQVVLTCIQTGLLMEGWFGIFVGGFGDPRAIMNAGTTRFVHIIHVTQWIPTATFFLIRAHNLIGRHWLIWTSLGLLMLASFSAGIACTMVFKAIPPPPILQKLNIFRTAAEVAVDIIITVSICYDTIATLPGGTGRTSVLGFLITIIVQGEGPAQTYWCFLPKLYTGVTILAVNARIKVENELRGFAGVYPPGSRNPDMAMPALARIGRFNVADEEEVPEELIPPAHMDVKEASTTALI